MINCGCNTGFICLTHRFEGRTGTYADSDLMAQNDVIDYLPKEIDKEIITTIQLSTMEKHIGKLEQWAKVWMDGRGGMS